MYYRLIKEKGATKMTQILRKEETIIHELIELSGKIRLRTYPMHAIYAANNKTYIRVNGSYTEVVEIMIDDEIEKPIYLIKKNVVIL
jgi:hypothetical protein